MDLSSLKPACGSTHHEKRLVADKVPEKEVLLQEDIKELNQDRVTIRRLVLKVVRCLCRDVYRNSALRISIV